MLCTDYQPELTLRWRKNELTVIKVASRAMSCESARPNKVNLGRSCFVLDGIGCGLDKDTSFASARFVNRKRIFEHWVVGKEPRFDVDNCLNFKLAFDDASKFGRVGIARSIPVKVMTIVRFLVYSCQVRAT